MANPAITVDPLDELRLMAPTVPDRLPAMLFLAALVHGTFGIARDLPTNVRAADVLRQRLELQLVRHRLRGLFPRHR